MYAVCWNCGQDFWIETQRECRHCGEATRRCADCVNYRLAGSMCQELNVEIDQREAERPTRLTTAFNCASYTPSPERTSAQRRTPAVTPPPARPAPVAPPAAPTARPAPVAAPPAPAAPVAAPDREMALADAEVITILREPAPPRPKHPVIIAHRGDSAAAPENTLAAFRSALAHGAQAMEFDIHLTRDGQAVVIHDATVDRCSTGKGAVQDLTLADLKSLDVGSWFAPNFTGERVPTLDEAIQAIPSPVLLIMHLRAHENESDRCERAVADAIVRNDVRNRTVVTHHTRHGLHRLRDLEPKLHLCWIGPGGEPGAEYLDDAYYMGYRFVQPTARDIDERLVAYARERGMWINAFWADEVADMRRLITLGVDGIITNHPARLGQTLQEMVGAS